MSKNTPSITVGGIILSKKFLLDMTRLALPSTLAQQRHYTPPEHLHGTWELVHFARNNSTSYCGALLKTTVNKKPTYIIWHYGTVDVRDVPSGLCVTRGRPPMQLKDALRFTKECKEKIAASDTPSAHVIQAGHSLGGALAVLANKEAYPCLTFDAPGTRHFMERLNRDPEKCRKHTVEILSPHENLVNTQGQHVGNILIAGQSHWKSDEAPRLKSFLEMTLASHLLRHLGAALEKTEDFTLHEPDSLGRSPSFFHAYLKFKRSHEGYKAILREDGTLDMSQLSKRERISLTALERTLRKDTAPTLENLTKALAQEISGILWNPWRKRTLENVVPTPIEQGSSHEDKRSWRERLTRRHPPIQEPKNPTKTWSQFTRRKPNTTEVSL